MAQIEGALYGYDLFGDPVMPDGGGALAEQFIVPPFSVLDAKQRSWQERKRGWINLGIQSEIGREAQFVKGKFDKPKGEFWFGDEIMNRGGAISIFDPVLCELMYRWFCPEGGQIVDPFAGGSVRGIVAARLGRTYWGCDLCRDQIAANAKQAIHIIPDRVTYPEWVAGDSRDRLCEAPLCDFIFSCPPYGDLERYSDDPRDLSAMSRGAFEVAYAAIIHMTCSLLKQDRFAAITVSNYRDGKGMYVDLVGLTVKCFQDCGVSLYKEIVFLTCIGSLPIRVTRYFKGSRKLGKAHQNVLVFCKGDPKKATQACAAVET